MLVCSSQLTAHGSSEYMQRPEFHNYIIQLKSCSCTFPMQCHLFGKGQARTEGRMLFEVGFNYRVIIIQSWTACVCIRCQCNEAQLDGHGVRRLCPGCGR